VVLIYRRFTNKLSAKIAITREAHCHAELVSASAF